MGAYKIELALLACAAGVVGGLYMLLSTKIDAESRYTRQGIAICHHHGEVYLGEGRVGPQAVFWCGDPKTNVATPYWQNYTVPKQ